MPAKKNSTTKSPKPSKAKSPAVATKGDSASAGAATNDAARAAALAKLQKVEPVPAPPPVILKGTAKPKAAKEPAKTAAKGGKARTGKADGSPRTGGLTAAHQVLSAAKEPMNVRDITKAAMDKGLWKPGGKTPSATLAAAIGREIKDKGKQSRFKKTDRGLFIAATPR